MFNNFEISEHFTEVFPEQCIEGDFVCIIVPDRVLLFGIVILHGKFILAHDYIRSDIIASAGRVINFFKSDKIFKLKQN